MKKLIVLIATLISASNFCMDSKNSQPKNYLTVVYHTTKRTFAYDKNTTGEILRKQIAAEWLPWNIKDIILKPQHTRFNNKTPSNLAKDDKIMECVKVNKCQTYNMKCKGHDYIDRVLRES